MIAAAGLVAYASLLLACGSPALARAAWPVRAPRLAIAASLAAAFPLPTLRRARDEVARLAELAADDAAAARSPRLVVAEALLTLGAAPAGAAAGGALAVAAMIALPAMVFAGPAVAAVVMGYCTHPAVTVYSAGLPG